MEEQEKLVPPGNSLGQMSFSCFKYFLIVVSYRIMKRLVENVLKKWIFSALQVFLGWLVRLGAGVAQNAEKDSAPKQFCS